MPFTSRLQTLARRVARFDWVSAPLDTAANLYQTVITAAERRQLGEYYTPSWLARVMVRELVDEAYPEVEVVRVVLDNLNTHRMASLYEAFPAAEARRIAKRLEFHYTPKHGSWLNMAEIEFSVLSRSCLRQRLPDEEALGREVQALVTERNTPKPPSTGASTPMTPEPNCTASIPLIPNMTEY